MRLLLKILLVCLGVNAWADGTPVAPATQAEVNAGTLMTKFVSPKTLASSTQVGGWTILKPSGGDDALVLSNALRTSANIRLLPGVYNASNCVVTPTGMRLVGESPDQTIWVHWGTNSPRKSAGSGSVAFYYGTNQTYENFTITNGVYDYGCAIGSYASNSVGGVFSFATRNMRIYEPYDGVYWVNETNTTWTDYGSEFFLRWDGVIPGPNTVFTNYGTVYHNTSAGAATARTIWARNSVVGWMFDCVIDARSGVDPDQNYAVGFDGTATINMVNCAIVNGWVGDAGAATASSVLNWYGGAIRNLNSFLGHMTGVTWSDQAHLIATNQYTLGPIVIQDSDGGANAYPATTSTWTNTFGPDVEVGKLGGGFILKSPNGARWRITVGNTGTLGSTAL